MSERPVVGVGAVVWKDDQVLMIRRGNSPGKGQWSIPGGKQEFGETTKAAAIREVLEETGVDIELLGLIGVYDSISPDGHFTLINYAARWMNGTPVHGGDALDARYMTIADIDSLEIWA
ncbi:MAG: NUDIX hydrolase, partial [Rhodospirillaceae bacterium]|nr:NUDIX hydrolase [Rhodospirillaceae bacterium]